MRACRTHLSPNHGPFPFPKDMFLKFVHENNGYFPVKIQALPEGTCVHVHTPVYQVMYHPPPPACRSAVPQTLSVAMHGTLSNGCDVSVFFKW